MINYTYPVVTTGVTLTELPDKISLFIEMGQCYNNCKGCHSDHLRCGVADKTSLQSIVYTVHNEIYKGANAVIIMGGTNNGGITETTLVALLKSVKETCCCVGLYSGLDKLEDHKMYIPYLDYLKIGSYKEDIGGLATKGTNQILYKITEGKLEDITGCLQRG